MNAQRSTSKRLSLVCGTLAILAAGVAQAAPTNSLNLLEVNPVDLSAEFANTLVLTIEGDENGGFGTDWPAYPIFAGAPAPGIFSQTGEGNSLSMSIFGANNLASVVQVGFNNTVIGTASGINNAVAVMQSGAGHYAAFSQVGTGNALSISQSSW